VKCLSGQNSGLLLAAAATGSRELLSALTKDDINAVPKKRPTALCLAIEHQDLDFVKELLEQRKPDVSLKCSDRDQPIHKAAMTGRVEAVELLIEHGAEDEKWGSEFCTPIGLAAKYGHIKLVQYFVDRQNAQGKSESREQALTLACRSGHKDVVVYLIENGVSLPTGDKYISNRHEAPLHIAAGAGHVEIVELLLDLGIKPDQSLDEEDMETAPLDWAGRSGRADVIKLLLDRGAKVAGRRLYAQPVIVCAAAGHEARFTESVRILLEYGSDVNWQDDHGRSALMHAAIFGNVPTARVLLDAGADIHAIDKLGMTALQGAIYGNQLEMVQFLIVQGADPNLAGTYVGNPLQSALYGQLRNTGVWYAGGGPHHGAVGGYWSFRWMNEPHPRNKEIVAALVEAGAKADDLELVERTEVERLLHGNADEKLSDEKEDELAEVRDRVSGMTHAITVRGFPEWTTITDGPRMERLKRLRAEYIASLAQKSED
jgi:ankyrin repeat protein